MCIIYIYVYHIIYIYIHITHMCIQTLLLEIYCIFLFWGHLNLGAPSPSPGSVSSSDPLRGARFPRRPWCPPWPKSQAAEPSPSTLQLSPGFSRESRPKDQNRRRDDGRTCLAEQLSLICPSLVAVSISCSSSTACQVRKKLEDGWPESVEEHSESCKYEDLIARSTSIEIYNYA